MTRRLLLLAATTLLASTSLGCATFTNGSLFSRDESVTKPEQPVVQGDRVVVEMYPHDGPPRRTILPLKPGDLVGQALQGAGAIDAFKRMTITIVRTPARGQRHKMDVTYDRYKRRVVTSQDYALYPNDRIIVREEVTSPLDGLFERFGEVGSRLGDRAQRMR